MANQVGHSGDRRRWNYRLTQDMASLFLAVYGEALDHKKRYLKLRDYTAASITHHPPFNRNRLPPPRLPERGV